jgi:hypothetical protein
MNNCLGGKSAFDKRGRKMVNRFILSAPTRYYGIGPGNPLRLFFAIFNISFLPEGEVLLR